MVDEQAKCERSSGEGESLPFESPALGKAEASLYGTTSRENRFQVVTPDWIDTMCRDFSPGN